MKEIKPKQWYRSGNTFYRYNQDENGILPHYMNIADIPQELVDCDDLICTESAPYPRFVFDRIKKKCVVGFNYDVDIKDITKIYTKDDRGNYIEQYSLPIK